MQRMNVQHITDNFSTDAVVTVIFFTVITIMMTIEAIARARREAKKIKT